MQTANFYSARDASRSFWNCEGYGCVYKKIYTTAPKILLVLENYSQYAKLYFTGSKYKPLVVMRKI